MASDPYASNRHLRAIRVLFLTLFASLAILSGASILIPATRAVVVVLIPIVVIGSMSAMVYHAVQR